MTNSNVKKLVLSALFLAIGLVLPLLTGQIKEIGDSLLPMHLPVMLCGLICGWGYGLSVGLTLPFLRGVIFGMPPIYPNAVWMALELATYGFVLGFLYNKLSKKSTPYLILYLICAMLSGRIVWGIAKAILLGVGGKPFTVNMFIVGGFIDAFLGIIIQLILIPIIMKLYEYLKKRGQI